MVTRYAHFVQQDVAQIAKEFEYQWWIRFIPMYSHIMCGVDRGCDTTLTWDLAQITTPLWHDIISNRNLRQIRSCQVGDQGGWISDSDLDSEVVGAGETFVEHCNLIMFDARLDS